MKTPEGARFRACPATCRCTWRCVRLPPFVWAAAAVRMRRAALLLGVHYPHLVQAVVASVPSNLASECYGGTCNGTDPAWTYRGRGIPPFSPIPVERIDGPIFAICGTRDLTWPSCPHAHAILTRRHAHHARFADRLVAAQGAGHFVGSAIPYQIYRFDPTYTQRAADETGAELAWPQLITFLLRAK